MHQLALITLIFNGRNYLTHLFQTAAGVVTLMFSALQGCRPFY
jgi:hypothetical protein